MRRIMIAILLGALSCLGVSQAPSPAWQTASIVSVKPHQDVKGDVTGMHNYDITLKVGNTTYLVLYSTRAETVKYRAGLDLPVLVEKDSITFNDLLGQKNTVPILSRETVNEEHNP